jgi:hypothetical protein
MAEAVDTKVEQKFATQSSIDDLLRDLNQKPTAAKVETKDQKKIDYWGEFDDFQND